MVLRKNTLIKVNFANMNTPIIESGQLDPEIKFSFSRSSGPGGQNVNKVNSKVELRFHIASSIYLSEDQKAIIFDRLATKLNSEGEILIVSQESRSQLQNKETALFKFYSLLNSLLKPRKRRIKTSASMASKEKRIQIKKQHSEKKTRRKWNI